MEEAGFYGGDWRRGTKCNAVTVTLDMVADKGALEPCFARGLKQLVVGRWYSQEQLTKYTRYCINMSDKILKGEKFNFPSGLDMDHPAVLKKAPEYFTVRVVDAPTKCFRFFRVDPKYWRDSDEPMPKNKQELEKFINERYPESFKPEDLLVYHDAKDELDELVEEGKVHRWEVGGTRKTVRLRSWGRKPYHQQEPFLFSDRAKMVLAGKVAPFTPNALSEEGLEKVLEKKILNEFNNYGPSIEEEAPTPVKRAKTRRRKQRTIASPYYRVKTTNVPGGGLKRGAQ